MRHMWPRVIRRRGHKLPRIRHPLIKFDEWVEPDHFSSTIDLYRQIYYQILETTAEQLAKRFKQANFANLVRLENLLLGATSGQTINKDFDCVYQLFIGDVDNRCSRNHLIMLYDLCRQTQNESLTYISLQITLMLIYHVFPVASASAARSFSSMSRLRVYFDI